jgi:hypothetical protein
MPSELAARFRFRVKASAQTGFGRSCSGRNAEVLADTEPDLAKAREAEAGDRMLLHVREAGAGPSLNSPGPGRSTLAKPSSERRKR